MRIFSQKYFAPDYKKHFSEIFIQYTKFFSFSFFWQINLKRNPRIYFTNGHHLFLSLSLARSLSSSPSDLERSAHYFKVDVLGQIFSYIFPLSLFVLRMEIPLVKLTIHSWKKNILSFKKKKKKKRGKWEKKSRKRKRKSDMKISGDDPFSIIYIFVSKKFICQRKFVQSIIFHWLWLALFHGEMIANSRKNPSFIFHSSMPWLIFYWRLKLLLKFFLVFF